MKSCIEWERIIWYEDKMASEMYEHLSALKQEEVESKENDEDRASEEKHCKRLDIILDGSVMITLVGGFAICIILIAKNKIKKMG